MIASPVIIANEFPVRPEKERGKGRRLRRNVSRLFVPYNILISSLWKFLDLKHKKRTATNLQNCDEILNIWEADLEAPI